MKCPYCQKEMQLGYIPSYKSPVEWLPKGSKPSPIAYRYSKNGVPLYNEHSLRFGFKAEAYHCDKCNIVLAYTKPE